MKRAATKTKKSVAQKPCTCMEQVDEKLVSSNTRLVRRMMFNFKTGEGGLTKQVWLDTEKIDSKKRSPKVEIRAAYCPFCGKKYL